MIDPVLELVAVSGPAAEPSAPLDLLIEIPHGATTTEDFLRVQGALRSPLPEGLVDFFHVNTDAGAPELGLAIAHRLVALRPTTKVAIARCRIPRTFIDCNRRLDASAEDFRAGKVTPGLPPWITAADDRQLLRDAYDRYVAAVGSAIAALGDRGALLLLHSYAPRSVDVEVDLDIVAKLRRAYQPEIEPTWPLRPALDLICREADGTDRAPRAVVKALTERMAALGQAVTESATYPLHPSTLAYQHVLAHPGRALCLEVRRDLLADPFEPFVQMRIGEHKVAPLAAAIAESAAAWW